ncbi:ATP-dependent helicase HrpA [Azoarcus sp. DD4]|uniref:endonuclease domain-containing protein n=1 Tax=Azoarcus sp. DD4 TaxID=2027405 RepID=UPI00112AC98C|nr:DUF559 domain-containing protein [Azoarcus sp. DD4]QDF98465.1 ATP-dependent helicase HrpA [Azoarcus sp. DD4]
MQGRNTPTKNFARNLRRNSTDAERVLWRHLRGGQFGAKFRRQHPFADYVLDFVCLELKLVVELDGGQHAERVAYDDARTAMLRTAGFDVIRFWNSEVFQEPDAVVERLRLVIEGRRPLFEARG